MPDSDPSKRVICGDPRLDLVKYHPQLLEIPNDYKTIGFVCRYPSINRYNWVPTIFSLQGAHKRNDVVWQIDNFVVMISIIHKLIKETDYDISIRVHPLASPEGYFFLDKDIFENRVTVEFGLDMAYWVANQKVIISPSSSGMFEPYILGVPIVYMDPLVGIDPETDERVRASLPPPWTSHDNYTTLVGENASFNPKNYSELLKAFKNTIPKVKKDIKVDEHLNNVHNWNVNESAIKNAADAILKVLKKDKPRKSIRLPLFFIKQIDKLVFKKACIRDPRHHNFNYEEYYHETPKHFETIVENIISNRSLYDNQE